MAEEEKIYLKFWSFSMGKQCLWISLSLEILWLLDKSIFRNIVIATRTEIHCRLFVWILSSLKFLKNCLWWSHFLIKKYNYNLQTRILLSSITGDFMTIYWNNICSSHLMKLHNYSLQPTTGPKVAYFSRSAQKAKDSPKFWKFEKKYYETVSSSLMLQVCSRKFLATTKQTPRKMFPVSYEMTGNVLWRDLQWSHFTKVTRVHFWKNTSCIFQGMFGKTPVMKILDDSQENTFGKLFLCNLSYPIYHL